MLCYGELMESRYPKMTAHCIYPKGLGVIQPKVGSEAAPVFFAQRAYGIKPAVGREAGYRG